MIANNEVLTNPPYTVGCSVEVKLHEYKEDTALQKTFFIEVRHDSRMMLALDLMNLFVVLRHRWIVES